MAPGNDVLRGGPGADAMAGDDGSDDHRGGDGNGYIDAQDGASDTLVDGGFGTDTCRFDAGLDQVVRGCEIQNPS